MSVTGFLPRGRRHQNVCVHSRYGREEFYSNSHSPPDLLTSGAALIQLRQCPEITLHDKPCFQGLEAQGIPPSYLWRKSTRGG